MQLTQALHKAAREHPERLATVCGARRQTFSEVRARVARLASHLHETGARPGDRIALLGGNTDRYLEALYACWWGGMIATPVNCRLGAEEVAYILKDSGARSVVVDDPFLPLLARSTALLGNAPRSVYIGGGETPAGMSNAATGLAQATPIDDLGTGGEAPAVLFYTGGTTGRAKGVVLSHAGLYTSTLAAMCISRRAAGVACLHALPMFHVGGLAVLLQAMACASTQVMLPAFDPLAFLRLIEEEQIVEAALVPTMIRRVLDLPELAQQGLSSLERLYYGASPIDETLLELAAERLPQVELTQFYGMTETSGIAVALPPWCHSEAARSKGLHRAAGFPTPCTEVRIAGADGQELPAGDIGEIQLRGPGVMQGYWNLPDQTALAIRGGWMCTGDAGYLDAQGLLYIVDRLKDMIVTGGENVYSVEVENSILSLDGIAQCAVIGLPDSDWGERVHAVVVLQPHADIDAAKVIAHCKSLIAGYKCPRSVEFRAEMPVSGAGKLLKYQLREPHWRNHGRQVA